jgi:glyoxylase-like metal-dependent hydrolase (beta-lactamase superfamily II)/rhodanese-related sulfurtransferase
MQNVVTVLDDGLGNSSYVVDLGDRRLLVLDPVRDPAPYLQEAQRRDARIGFTVETHLHADFVSGSRELAGDGAALVASQAAGLEFPHKGVGDGDEIDLGGLTLRALATPGHTPEHLSYLLLDGSRPLALFSGGALLPGAVARTDLISPEQTESLARALYRSVTERLFTLPDDVVVYPTHGTGATFCVAAPGHYATSTTIGDERTTNPLFAAPDEDTFVALLLDSYGTYPRYFTRLREVNRIGPRVYGDRPPGLPPLSAPDVVRMMKEGAEVVDARPIADFAAGHIPRALSNELRHAFATWLGWLVPDDLPLVFVLNDDQDRAELVRECLKIGYEHFAGELAGGMATWRAADLDETRIPLLEPKGVNALPGSIVDVRQAGELAERRVPGAFHTELGSLAEAERDLPAGPLTLMCGHGERAMTAASLLERSGRRDLSVFRGGPEDATRLAGPGAGSSP